MTAWTSALYEGAVVHERKRPRRHRLEYRVFWMLFDLDELARMGRALRWFGHERFNLFGFYGRDHGDGSATPLKRQVETHLATAGIETGGPIRLLCMPRVLGFVFNPLSIYFCHGRDGGLGAILYEVNNTFGQRHSYLIAVDPAQGNAIRQSSRKLLYVSPFNGMEMGYAFRVRPPETTEGNRVAIAVDVIDGTGLLIATAMSGKRIALTDQALLAAFIGQPLLTLKVIAGIHWEALRLWLKGMKMVRRPQGPANPVSIGSSTAG